MAVINETVYKELESLFGNLKKISQCPDIFKQDAGDKTEIPLLDEQFSGLHKRIDEILSTISKDDTEYIKVIAMKGSLYYEDAKFKLTMQDYNASKTILETALDVINEHVAHSLIQYLHLRIVNHLAFTFTKLNDFAKARDLLSEITGKKTSADVAIYSTDELFSTQEVKGVEIKDKLHSIQINNLQMLSWVYSKMNSEKEATLVQHKILALDLDYEECDPVDWAIRCTQMATLYLLKLEFVPARYYLSAAGAAIERIEAILFDHPELSKAQAELARGWIYYGLRLFDTSKSHDVARLCNKIFEEDDAESKAANEVVEEEPLDEANKFPNSDVKLVNVPAKYITNNIEAHVMFQHTQMWLKRARVYYTLRDYPFIYVNCVLDLSELYRYLAYYETDIDAQYNVQRRRADALETLSTILKEVRPQCYIAVSVELLRELAEVQIELMGINIKRMYKQQELVENQESLRKRMEGVFDIQTKLDKVGTMLGNTRLEENISPSTSYLDNADSVKEENQTSNC